MAEWEHKEWHWKTPQISGHNITQWAKEGDEAIYTTKSFRRRISPREVKLSEEDEIERQKFNIIQQKKEMEWKNKGISFVEFLDLHCKGGWEVLKISRDFNSQHQDTWCIFRRLV